MWGSAVISRKRATLKTWEMVSLWSCDGLAQFDWPKLSKALECQQLTLDILPKQHRDVRHLTVCRWRWHLNPTTRWACWWLRGRRSTWAATRWWRWPSSSSAPRRLCPLDSLCFLLLSPSSCQLSAFFSLKVTVNDVFNKFLVSLKWPLAGKKIYMIFTYLFVFLCVYLI